MKLRNIKIALCMLFITIFTAKMVIAAAPAMLNLNKTFSLVMDQLDQETKGEKDAPEKDFAKDKKFFDESFTAADHHKFIILESAILHSREKSLFRQVYHPVVPTPPPNV